MQYETGAQPLRLALSSHVRLLFSRRLFRRMVIKQTLFASNTDEIVTDDDASSCKLTINQAQKVTGSSLKVVRIETAL